MPWTKFDPKRKCPRCGELRDTYYLVPSDPKKRPQGRCFECHSAALRAKAAEREKAAPKKKTAA